MSKCSPPLPVSLMCAIAPSANCTDLLPPNSHFGVARSQHGFQAHQVSVTSKSLCPLSFSCLCCPCKMPYKALSAVVSEHRQL